MKFIVEFCLKPESKDKVVEIFESRGPNLNPGVSFRGAWLGTRSSVAFVLMETSEESLLDKACQFWKEHGTYQIHPVIDIEHF